MFWAMPVSGKARGLFVSEGLGPRAEHSSCLQDRQDRGVRGKVYKGVLKENN